MLKEMELQMWSPEQAVKAANLRADNAKLKLKAAMEGYRALSNFLLDAVADPARLAGHLCKGLEPAEAFFQGFCEDPGRRGPNVHIRYMGIHKRSSRYAG